MGRHVRGLCGMCSGKWITAKGLLASQTRVNLPLREWQPAAALDPTALLPTLCRPYPHALVPTPCRRRTACTVWAG